MRCQAQQPDSYSTGARHARRPRSGGNPLLHLPPHTRRSRPASATIKKKNNVTTISPREIVGPPPSKGMATTFNAIGIAKTKPPNPSATIHRLLRGVPPPVGKAGFDVWVLTKGGISLYQHAVRTILCMVSPTCKYAHLLFGRVRPDPVMCVY